MRGSYATSDLLSIAGCTRKGYDEVPVVNLCLLEDGAFTDRVEPFSSEARVIEAELLRV